MNKCVLQTNTIQIKHNKVRIPTTGRLTSWLFTRRGGVEFGATEDKSIQWQGGGLEPGTSGIQVQRPITRPRTPPEHLFYYPAQLEGISFCCIIYACDQLCAYIMTSNSCTVGMRNALLRNHLKSTSSLSNF